MRLRRDWKKTARHSKSFFWSIVGFSLSGAATAFQYLFGVLPVSPQTFFMMFMVIYILSAVLRLMHNPELDD